ncbi:hypothetical protein [Priestia filamentosa]|uniref:hypothetical protein n=1 Tax=Priestia filamentosa TaxID=1402861 RepID=UPI00397C4516
MSQLKRSFLIGILILSAMIIGFVSTLIDYHIINVMMKIIVIAISFVVAGLMFQSREEGIDTIVNTIRNRKK